MLPQLSTFTIYQHPPLCLLWNFKPNRVPTVSPHEGCFSSLPWLTFLELQRYTWMSFPRFSLPWMKNGSKKVLINRDGLMNTPVLFIWLESTWNFSTHHFNENSLKDHYIKPEAKRPKSRIYSISVSNVILMGICEQAYLCYAHHEETSTNVRGCSPPVSR